MPHEIATRRVLYEIPGMDAIVPKDFEFRGSDGEPLPGRIYSPLSDRSEGVVLIVGGHPDPAFVNHVGCRFMDMQWSISMAQLIAASGLAAITYSNRQPAPDVAAIVEYLTANAASLKIDASRLAFWVTSGNGPVAISMLGQASCAVLWNPIIRLREDASTSAKATADRSARQAIPVPIFVVRSGKDENPGLNDSLDQFIANALAQNAPITMVNHPEARHSFELYDNSDAARLILRQAVEFLKAQLHT